jgi:hypothetical protein
MIRVFVSLEKKDVADGKSDYSSSIFTRHLQFIPNYTKEDIIALFIAGSIYLPFVILFFISYPFLSL